MGRNHTTLADYMVLAISPALIMAMIGAFVFFLIEVFYGGQFEGRLQFICAMFILGAVMIGRLSMTEGAGYASLFAAPLGLLTAIAMMRFVPYSGSFAALGFVMNLVLLTVIWYAAHKLTWSCTYIENTRDASSQGLLQSMGMSSGGDDTSVSQGNETPQTEAESSAAKNREQSLTGEDPAADNPLQPWLDWFERARKKPQKPGAWIVYFALIALPLFGMGQWSIDYADLGSRRYVFWLLCLYVAASLALLATTSFLGLRRYLRRRGLEMPVNIAGLWLGLGGCLIVVVLFIAWLFPRPSLEYSVAQVQFGDTRRDYTTSEYATGDDGVKHEPDGTSAGHDEHAEPAAEDGDEESDSGSDGGEGEGKTSGEGEGKSGGDGGKKPGGDAEEDGSAEDGSEEGESGGGKGESEADNKSEGEKASKSGDASKVSEAAKKESTENAGRKSQTPRTPDVSQMLSRAVAWLGQLLKWGFYLLLAAVVAFFAYRNREAIAAAWRQLLHELRELWAKWMGGRDRGAGELQQEQPKAAPPRPFSSFANPFLTGAPQQSTDQIVAHTFQALEAWAREQGCMREEGETPVEFASRLAVKVPHVSSEARHLASLYSRVAYGGGGLARQNLPRVETLWQLMGQNLAPPVTV